MTPDEIQLAKVGIEQALKPYSNLIERLFGPAFDVASAGISAGLMPWAVQRQLRAWKRVQEMISEAGFKPQPVPPKMLLPIIQGASIEDEDELQDKWAALLANASSPTGKDSTR